MDQRPQQTIRNAVEASGIGFLTGATVTIRLVPAAPNYGIRFQRIDSPGSKPIPARLEYTVPRQRRTAIEHEGVAVEMVEHVMAALAGLRIDNCLVQLNAPEPPGFDGSSAQLVKCLLETGTVEQEELQPVFTIGTNVQVSADDGSEICATPLSRPALTISYRLDYGDASPIPAQDLTIEITPETFINDLAFARTFVLESEVEALRAQGYGSRTTAQELLVYGKDGVIDNTLRADDECVRHKILDCVGDFALMGCDIRGHLSASRSGHHLNRELVRRLQLVQPNTETDSLRHAA